MPLAVPLVVVGGALFIALLLYTYLHWAKPLLHGVSLHIPLIGGALTSGINRILTYFYNTVKAWLDTQLAALVHWLLHLVTYVKEPFVAFSSFAEGVATSFEHLVTARIPTIVNDFVAPVRRDVATALRLAQSATKSLAQLDTAVDGAVAGIVRALRAEFTNGIDRLRVDLNDAFTARLRNGIDTLRRDVAGELTNTQTQLDTLTREIGSIFRSGDARKISELVAGLAGVTALVTTIATEAGLSEAECRAKVRGICGVDSAEWEGLLAGLVGGLSLVAFPEMVRIAEGIFSELHDDVLTYVGQR